MTTPTTTLKVTFVSESAAYESTFGWYNKVTGYGGILFADVEQQGYNAPLTPGVSSVNFTVNTADLGNIQFFLISDGYNLNQGDPDDLTGAIKVIQLSDGSWAVADVDSHGNVITEHGKTDILQGRGANALFTETSKNAGGVDYASSVAGTSQTAATLAGDTADGATGTIAWEDLVATRNHNGTYSKPGDADYNDAVFNVAIVGGNHAPVANADSVSLSEDAGLTTINVLANDTDPDAGDTLHVAAVNAAGVLGTVTISGNGLGINYTPAASFQSLRAGQTATETFSYTVADQAGATSSATVTVTIVGANDGPVAVNDTASATEAGGVNNGTPGVNPTGNVLANDTDPDSGDTKTVSAVAGLAANVGQALAGSFGTLTLNADGSYSYAVNNANATVQGLRTASDTLTDNFTYTVKDSAGATSTATLAVTIHGANDAPVTSAPVQGAGNEGAGTFNVNLLQNASDVDVGSVLHVANLVWTDTGSGLPAGFTVSPNGNAIAVDTNSLAYNAMAQGETFVTHFGYDVVDEQGALVHQTATITITGTNDAPVVSAAVTGTGDEGAGPFSVNLLQNASDVDHGAVLHVANLVWSEVPAGFPTGFTVSPDGNSISVDTNNPAYDAMAQGDTFTTHFTYDVVDEFGAIVHQTATITITGTNDGPVAVADTNAADPVVESGVAVGGNTPLSGDPTASGNVLANDTDVDTGDTRSVTTTGSFTGVYGTLTLASDGSYTYMLNNADPDTNALAQGESASDVFAYTIADSHGATSSSTLTIAITGTNDQPTITGGPTTGPVQEDTISSATGKLVVADPDHGALQFWSVVGGSGAANADYHFRADSFSVVKGATSVLQDDFSDGLPPPNSPPLNLGGPNQQATTYIVTGGFTESGGELHIDSNNAVSVVDVGSPDPLIGQVALVRTNIDPASTLGLKLSQPFTVTGIFDLVVPDSPREQYGIRLTDRLIGGSGNPPDQVGDNTYDLVVRENTAGQKLVTLRHIDFFTNVTTNLQSFTLAPSGADQIKLVLDHVANSTTVQASFLYLSGGLAVGGNTFAATAPIFAPGSADTEVWTRAGIVAFAPATSDSLLSGLYGNLDIDQTGTWTYTLDNTRTVTQNLAGGQHATDAFTVQVADQFGATDTRTINIDVVGTNDAPIMQTPAVLRALTEDFSVDGSGNLTATGLAQFSDVDLTDTHTVSVSLQSSAIGVNTPLADAPPAIPPALLALLPGAMTATLTDPATGDGHGGIQWNFALNNNALQFLGFGQVVTLKYLVNATDPFGATTTQTVTVVINGNNDTPAIVAAGTVATGAVTESPANVPETTHQVTGSVAFTDADLTDTHTAGVFVPAPGNHGSLSAVIAPGHDSTGGVTGTATWTYSVDDASLDSLAQGQVATDSFKVLVPDASGGIAQQDITITLTGSNDTPVVQTPDEYRSFTEDDSALFTASATANFTDIDTTDTHTVASALQLASLSSGASLPAGLSSQLASAFSTTFVNDDAVFVSGTYSWNFSLDDNTVQFLAQGEVLNLTYRIDTLDPFGGVASQNINVAITGTNDAPVIITPDGSTTTTGPSSVLVFHDNFDQEHGGHGGQLIENYTGFQNWNVTHGAVDFYDEPYGIENVFPGNGGYVDLAGTSSDFGTLTSKTTYGPGTYTLTFDIGGTGRIPIYHNNPDGVAVTFGSYSENFMPGDSQIIHVTRQVTLTSSAQLSFADLGLSGNAAIGAMLFDVSVTQDDVTGSVTGNPALTTLATSGTFAFTDVDLLDTHSVMVTAAPGAHGTLTAHVSTDTSGTGTGGIVTWDYQVDEAAAAALTAPVVDTFTVTLSDNPGATAQEVIRVAVLPPGHVNTAPVAVADTDSVVESGLNPANTPFGGTPSATGNVLANDTDADSGDTHTVTAVNGSAANVGAVVNGTYGTLTLDSFGTYTYTLDNTRAATDALAQGVTAADVFTYTNSDNHGGSSATTLTINVTGTNDAPVAVADTNAGDPVVEAGVNPGNTPFAGDTTASGNVLANDTDVDAGDTHTVTAINGNAALVGTAVSGAYGTLTLNADGSYSYAINNASPATNQLGQGETGTDIFAYTDTDNNGASNATSLSITITGTNDAPVAVADITGGVVESGVAVGGNTALAGNPTTTGNVLANDSDADHGDTRSVTTTGDITGTFGTLHLNTDGSYTYTLNNADPDTNALAQGESASDVFSYTIADSHGATSSSTLTVNLTGANDQPVITGGSTSGSVKEDVSNLNQATGQLNVVDPDHGATRTWTVVGGTPSGTADYHFRADSFTVVKGATVVLQDDFLDGLPPPNSPPLNPNNIPPTPTTYGGSGTFTESGGKLFFDSNNAVSFVGVGTNDPIIGQDAIVRTSVDSNPTGLGLKKGTPFTISGVFDLVLPDSPREAYGIRATDRLTSPVTNADSTVTPAQLGDNTYELVVRQNTSGQDVVSLRHLDFNTNVTTNLQNVTLTPPVGADQITLKLNHVANSTDLVASFQYMSGGVLVGGPQNFSVTAPVFAPGSADTEVWTRAEIVAYAPQFTDSILGGSYGTLDTGQSGSWTYALNNALASTQSLSEGQHATDTFNVKVADQFGAFDTRTITIDVVGTNDAPVIQPPAPVSPLLFEDSAPTLSSFGFINFSDVDLQDTHAVSTGLQSAVVSGGTLPASLLSLVQTALQATLVDPATGDGHGQYRWDFALDNSAVQFLGQGQNLTLSYQTIVTDSSPFGSFSHPPVSQNVTVTIVGQNDAPVMETGPVALTRAEDGDPLALTASGQAQFSDADLADTHIFPVTLQSATLSSGAPLPVGLPFVLPSAMTGSLLDPATGDGHGQLQWNFSLANSLTQFLAQGETLALDYHVNVSDPFGAAAFEDVTINVTGVNDAPIILGSSSIDLGPLLTGNGPTTPGQPLAELAGNFSFSDADYSDIHIVGASFNPLASSPGGPLGTLHATELNETTIGAGGLVHWSYLIDPAVLNALPTNTVRHESFDITLDDGHGGSAVEHVTVNIGSGTPMSVSNFTTLTYPVVTPAGHGAAPAGWSIANDVNNLGQIAGHSETYFDPTIQGFDGWIYSNGSFTTVHIGNQNVVEDINSFGILAGFESPGNSTPRYGFIQNGATVTTIDLPPNASTTVDGINDAGNFVGSSYLYGGNTYSAFVNIGGVYTFFNPFGSNDAHANGINNLNDIIGTYSSGGVAHSFLDHNGIFTNVDKPGALQTIAVDINNAGQIAGYYQDSGSLWHGFINTNGVFTTIDNPLATGSAGTAVNGINDAGQVVGSYYDAANVPHAFVATINNPVGQSTNDVLVANPQGGTLAGGLGNDTFVFNAVPQTQSVITDFVHGQDILQISAAGFDHGLTTGVMPNLLTGAHASVSDGPNGYFIFDNTDPTGGTLYYDATGGSGADAVAIAKLAGVTALLTSDFHIV